MSHEAIATTMHNAMNGTVSMLNHQTPNAAINAAATRPPPTPSQAESIAQILQAGWHLLNLINEILDLAVIESGKVSLSLASAPAAEWGYDPRDVQGPARGIRRCGGQLRGRRDEVGLHPFERRARGDGSANTPAQPAQQASHAADDVSNARQAGNRNA